MFAATTSAFRYICSCARMPRCQSREEEAAFLHQHQEWLVHGTVVLITVGILGFAGVCTQDLQLEQARPEQPFAWELPDARFPTFIFRIIIIFVGVFAVSCICTTKSMQPEWATLVAEYTFAALSILTAVGGTLLNAWRGPALQGVDPRESWVQDAESSEIISIARMFTMIVVISVLPLRCSTVLVHHLIVAVSTVIIRVSFPGPFRGTDTWINMMVTVVVCFSFTGMYRLESLTRQSWMAMRTSQATVEVTQSALERQQATFDVIRSVLRVLFDVVLQMGETLTVTAENCNFSGVSPNAVDRGVFGEVDNSALTGVRLPDLLVPEDRDRLWTLAHNASTLNVPQLMTGTLLNSGGERIQHAVEIVMADTNLDGGQKYLVGIRFPPLPLDNEVDPVPDDFRDQARQNESRTLQAVPSTGRRRRRRGRDMMIQDAGPSNPSETDVSGITSDSNFSRSWMPMYIGRGSSGQSEVVAIINSASPEYEIAACTASFANLCEPNPVGQAFLPWVVDPDRFSGWLSHQANTLLYTEDEDAVSPGVHLSLRPPSAIAKGIEFRVCVKVCVVPLGPAEEDRDDCIFVQLLFDRVRWRPIPDGQQEAKFCTL